MLIPTRINDDFNSDSEEGKSQIEFENEQAEIAQQKEDERKKKDRLSGISIVDQKIARTKRLICYAPPVNINYRFDLTTKQRMKILLTKFDLLENFQISGFNRGMLSFGKSWFTVVSLVASIALAFQWMQSEFGVDVVGGSEILTACFTVVLAMVLDLVAFMLLAGLLAGLKDFLGMERHVAMLNKVMVFAAFLGTVGFGMILVQRFAEVSL